ncbi:hypothetical protein SERLA73DRAFT_144098 [Serpula lacrymans var. lacrymans S7.3]|uniref:SMP-30/Gluconolactonase/LRE-like region domain-containing protein n=2 Tax=Serpula lacrymans var. lacrymans TaxID=341189 RepID=F8QB17_SERL3|nr:hypothetical protein SERLA73DRAFT_144098 [Serpula lacrymans var. lacrymans S7.3]
MTKLSVSAVVVALAAAVYSTASSSDLTLPPQAVYVNPLSWNVLGANSTLFRNSSIDQFFNPTNTTSPFFQVFDPSFLNILGPNANFRTIVANPGFAFAHEAPIYDAESNILYFSSNDGGPLGYNGWYNNSVVSMLNMTEVEEAIASTSGNVNIQIQTLPLPDTVQMTNGGTGPYKGDLLLVTSGRALLPPSVVLVNPVSPYNATVLLDNFYGRQFNSLNDVKVLPGTDIIYFTDPTYGWLNSFRPEPLLPSQVYRLDPSTGQVRVVADQFINPNGVAFTADGRTAFVTDTGVSDGFLGYNQTYPATIYQYDVDPATGSFMNRRVFAYADTGVPDGIQLDTMGNVYSGCGEGTHVWNPEGTLIGKFFINSTTAEMMFTKAGLVILDEETIYLAQIQAQGTNLVTL